MEQLVRVRSVRNDGTAQVILVRESACSGDCHKCSGCGTRQQTMLFEAVNAIGAKPGELVTVQTQSGPVLAAAAVLCMMPVALFFLGYLAGALLWSKGALTGGLAFVLGIGLAAIYDRKVVKKQNTVYTITGYPAANVMEAHTKGDNDLD